jgi:uncharacterized protein (TIGR02145 family)
MNKTKIHSSFSLALLFLLVMNYGFSQSKKKQIQQLTWKVDSLNLSIENQRQTQKNELNKLIEKKEVSQKRIDSVSVLDKNKLNEKKNLSKEIDQLIVDKNALFREKLSKEERLKQLDKNKLQEIETKSLKTETKIGEQIWMTQNLDVVTFRNGDSIFHAKNREEWYDACEKNKPAYILSGIDIPVKLYNWYAVTDKRGLAPTGWHVPSISEWKILISNVGNCSSLKLRSKNNWPSIFSEGMDIYDFAAIPGGMAANEGDIHIWGAACSSYFWSSTTKDKERVYISSLGNAIYAEESVDAKMEISECIKDSGCSVRFIKD